MGTKTPAQRRRAKYADFLRANGTPLMVTEAERQELGVHLRELRDAGMSYRQIADSAPGGHSETSVAKIINHRSSTTHRDVYNDLKQATWIEPTVWRSGSKVTSPGPRRRLRALAARGFGYSLLGEFMGVSLQAVYQLCISEGPTAASTASRIATMYDKLAMAEPADYGVTRHGISRSKGAARRKGWAPPECWDDDTIDDPDAFPEWTGECGTVDGYYLHLRHAVLVQTYTRPSEPGRERRRVLCKPCLTARNGASADEHDPDLDIKDALREGHTRRAIAKEFGVSTRTVERIAKELRRDEGWTPPPPGPRTS